MRRAYTNNVNRTISPAAAWTNGGSYASCPLAPTLTSRIAARVVGRIAASDSARVEDNIVLEAIYSFKS